MKALWIYISLVILVGFSEGELKPPERSYKILMLLPVSSKSHRNVFIPLAEALVDRGHKIVMLSNHEKPLKHPNIEEIYHGLPYFRTDDMNMFDTRNNPEAFFQLFSEALPRITSEIFSVPEVKDLYNKRKEFDLIILDHNFNEAVYPFLHEVPFITVATCGLDPRQSAVLGNPINPAYMKNNLYKVDISTAVGRLFNLIYYITPAVQWRYLAVVPPMQKLITAQFPDLPPLLEIEANLSLTLMNYHFSTDVSVPLLPSQIEVGGMQCRLGKPLPEDLKSWIEGAGPAGVVYFSLGSVARGDSMPARYRDICIEAFRKLKQRVIWKFEGELDNVPKNVLIRKWLPQQDILAHANVKVFISHGGALSIHEASYHGVPMLVIPIFADQTRNADLIAAQKRGLYLEWENLTEKLLLESLMEIISNPTYKENMVAVSSAFRDQLESPRDRAMFWTEYVIRHKGAPMLRSPAAELSWVQFLLLDVLALVISILLGILLIFRLILRSIFNVVFGKKGKKKIE